MDFDTSNAAWHDMDNWRKAYDAETERLLKKLHGRSNQEMDMSKYAESESKDLKAKDYIGKNFKLTISGVEIVHFEATEKQQAQDRPRITFRGKEKGLVLNASNTQVLNEAYGTDSEDWLDHEIGLSVVDYTAKGFGHGWKLTPLDIAPPDFDDDIP